MPIPSGTVTFLFTDIEGSTKLWEVYPDAMGPALARHDALLRQAIEDNHGYVFKTVGDAFCAAFTDASKALHAALASQMALRNEEWGATGPLRVRIALHTGEAQERDGDYFGLPLSHVARLQSVGYGQQTLLSRSAVELVGDTLPPEATLQDLGMHRLKDLQSPERVFQLNHPALPAEFPPLRSLDNPGLPNNLPQQVTSFIGREKEIAEVKALLGRTRLLTLTGSGGCGKTRLGLQVAADLLENYADGAWFVELAPLADPALIPQALAQALNVTEEPGKPLMQTLTAALKDRKMLLMLDNCEHVLEASARLVDTLLRGCPMLQILASSREGLGIAGETVYRIPSLSLPDLKQTATPTSLTVSEAVRLFVDRAAAAFPAFSVTNQNAPALASICYQLDGIPLALELAAARARSLSVEEINGKLDNRFRLLTGGSRTALPRQQTLRALIDWSYDLLNTQEKTLLCRLSVFVGGWTLAAAEQVGSGTSAAGEGMEAWEVLDLLTSLADKSLVFAQAQGGTTRYRLLETVRQYARDRLLESGESLRAHTRHSDYYLALAEEAQTKLKGSEQVQWLGILEEEHGNLRQALTWYTGDAEAGEKGLRLGAALQQFWWKHGHLSEGRERLRALLAHPGGQNPTPARASALNGAGALANMQGDHAEARALHEESLALHRALGNRKGIAASLNNLGTLSKAQGDYPRARALLEESLTIERETGERWGIAASLNNLGNMAMVESDYAAARVLYEESLEIRRELGDTSGIAWSLLNMGNLAQEQNDFIHATVLHEECLAMFRALGDRWGIALSLLNTGTLAQEVGDTARARALLTEGLNICKELGDKRVIAYGLEALASLALTERQAERCVRLCGAAAALREAIGSPLSPAEREKWEREMTAARETLGEEVFAAAWALGRAMTLEQAIEHAMQEGAS